MTVYPTKANEEKIRILWAFGENPIHTNWRTHAIQRLGCERFTHKIALFDWGGNVNGPTEIDYAKNKAQEIGAEIEMFALSGRSGDLFDQRKIARKIIRDNDPDYLIAVNDISVPFLIFLSKFARHSIILSPYFESTNPTRRPKRLREVMKPRIRQRLLWFLYPKLNGTVVYFLSVKERLLYIAAGCNARIFSRGNFGDSVMLMGSAFRDLYAHYGIPVRKLQVMGSLEGDAIYDFVAGADRKEVRNAYGIPHDATVFSYFVPSARYNWREYLEDFEFALNTISETWDNAFFLLRAKPGPKERKNYQDIVDIVASRPNMKLMTRDDDIQSPNRIGEMLVAADVVVTHVSTLRLYAMSLGLPILSFNFLDVTIWEDFTDIVGDLGHCRSRDDFRELVRNIRDSGTFRKELGDKGRQGIRNHLLFDGQGVERLREFMITRHRR